MSSYDWRVVPVPARVRERPTSPAGYPIPYTAFVGPDGRADFRVLDVEKQLECLTARKCAICGKSLDYYAWFIGGLLVELNRIVSDPGMHEACAEYSARVCPYLARDGAHFSERAKPDPRDGHDITIDEDGMYERQHVMFLLKANKWRVVPNKHTPGTYYGEVERWLGMRYFINGREVDRDEAIQALRENPPDAKTVEALEYAERHHENKEIARKITRQLAEIERNRII